MKVVIVIGCPPGDPCLQAWGAMESRPRREAVLSERPNLARLQAAWCTPGCNVPSRLRYRLRQLLGLPAAWAWPEEAQTREVSTRSFSRYRCCLVAGCPTTTPASQKRTLRSPFRKPLALAMGFLTCLMRTYILAWRTGVKDERSKAPQREAVPYTLWAARDREEDWPAKTREWTGHRAANTSLVAQ